MRRNIYIIAILFLSFSINYSQAVKKFIEKSKTDVEAKGIDVFSIDKNKDGKVFQCPMDWEVLSDKSGECNICGMNLKELKVKAAQENLEKYLSIKNKKSSHSHSEMMKEKAEPNLKVWNSVCPLDGEKVNTKGKLSEYKGKNIAFCCDECKIGFDKSPEKYMKNISSDGKKYIAKK